MISVENLGHLPSFFCLPDLRVGMHNFGKCVGYPLVDAFPCIDGGGDNLAVQRGFYPDDKFTGKWLVGNASGFLATFKVEINRLAEGVFKFGHCFTMKANCVTDADDVAKQNVVIGVKFNFGGIALVTESVHGVTPALIFNSGKGRLGKDSGKCLTVRAVYVNKIDTDF